MSQQDIQVIRRAAEAGDAQAQYELALYYLLNAGSDNGLDQAVTWLHRAAQRSHPDALFALARLYLQGRAGASDSDPINRALNWLLRAKELGHPEAGKYFQAVMTTLQANHPGEYDSEYDDYAEEADRDSEEADYNADDYSTGSCGVTESADEDEAAGGEASEREYLIIDDKMLSSRKSLLTLAEMGNSLAMAILGEFWISGQDGPKDEQKGLEWLQKAAEKDEPHALYRLGSLYLRGSDAAAQDFTKARQFLFRAVALGSSKALFALGELYAHAQNKGQDYRKASQYFQKALDSGHLPAYARLAELYAQGLGVPQDDAKALELYTQGARQGDSAAQYGLALAYLNGQGTEPDLPRALKWLRKAAENGFAPAREQLDKLEPPAAQSAAAPSAAADEAAAAAPTGQRSADGNTAVPSSASRSPAAGPSASSAEKQVNANSPAAAAQPLSLEDSVRSAGRAAAAAIPPLPDLASFAPMGEAAATLQARHRATPDPILELRLRHAEQSGDAIAACHMGVVCEKARDWESARRWYAQAAGQGEVLGLYNLGVLWETGRGGSRDWQQALACYAQAAHKNYAKAQYNLCLLYARGQGTERDLEQARSWCVKAADQGLPEARKLLEVFDKHAEAAGSTEAQTETAGA